VSALAFFYAVVDSDERVLKWVAAGMVLAACAYALCWPTQWDFRARPSPFQLINRLGCWINTHAPRLPGTVVSKNLAGGRLAPVLPFAIALAWRCWTTERSATASKGLALIATGGVITIGFSLFLTSSRQCWLGLLAAGSQLSLAWVQRKYFSERVKRIGLWAPIALPLLGMVVAVSSTGKLRSLLEQIQDSTGSLKSRMALWDQGLELVRDYGFTGVGYGNSMVHPTYGLLIHVPFVKLLHNAFLQGWVEDGFLGAAGLAWGVLVCCGWAWQALTCPELSYLGVAGLAALAVMVVQNFFDDHFVFDTFRMDRKIETHWLRHKTLMGPGVLLGLVAGFVRRAVPPAAWPPPRSHAGPILAAAALAATGVTLFHRRLLGTWHANLGALEQTRVELGAYDAEQFDRLTLDQVRQREDLGRAQRQFHQALAWDSANVTARQRLAQIALSRGEYAEALAHLQVLWNSGSRDRRTRLLLGDALVAEGQVQEAATVIGGLPWAQSRLLYQVETRYRRQKDFQRAGDACETILLLDPGNRTARSLLEKVRPLRASGA
jgi:hypothetical protein